MSSMTLLGYQMANFLAEAAGCMVVAAVLIGFYRAYGRDFHRQWAWSWGALSVYLVSSGGTMLLSQTRPPTDALRLAASLLTLIAGYWHLARLGWGTWELTSGRLIPRRTGHRVLVGLALLAFAVLFLFAGDPDARLERIFVRFSLRALAAGLLFLWSAYGVWTAAGPRRVGRKVLAGSFAAYGLENLYYFGLGLSSLLSRSYPFPAHVVFLGLVDLLLVLLMGMGLVLWILEEERDRVLTASRKIEYLASYDDLTGLPNLKTFRDRLHIARPQATRSHTQAAVLLLDLDRFKALGDSFGHGFGNEVLRAVANRLRRTLQEGDTAARIGRDVFLLLVPGLPGRDAAEEVARGVLGSLAEPFRVHGKELFISASIGICLYPGDGDGCEELISNAGIAATRAWDEGGGTYRFHDPSLSARAHEQLELEHEVRRALAEGELLLHYQPWVAGPTGGLLGFEALARWRHPHRGILEPRDFLPVVERIGLSEGLDRWALGEAVRQLCDWRSQGFDDLFVSVNVSSIHFRHPYLIAELERLLRQTDLPPRCLVLEVTETAAMQDPEDSLRVMGQIRRLGARISIDDFGTGYSSLSYLRHLPVNGVKIDRSFVRDLPADLHMSAIVQGILALAGTLRLEVVAEGVETRGQHQLLCDLGCRQMQGYLFGPPTPPDECRRYLEEPALGCVGL